MNSHFPATPTCLQHLAALIAQVEGAGDVAVTPEGNISFKMAGDAVPRRWWVSVKAAALTPKQVEAEGLRLREAVRAAGDGAYGVLAAPYLSRTSCELLVGLGLGAFDLCGNALISTRGMLIRSLDHANTSPRRDPQRSLFTSAGTRVLRALLDPANARRAWTVRAVAAAAWPGCSLGQTQRVLALLDEQNFLSRADGVRGIVLRDPEKLLRAWGGHEAAQRRIKPLGFFSLMPESRMRTVVADMAAHGHQIALASFSAADTLAPMVMQNRLWLRWHGDIAPLVAGLEMKTVDSGSNIAVIEARDLGSFYPAPPAPGGIPCSCAVQTFVDLCASPARGEEAAEALFDSILRKAYAP